MTRAVGGLATVTIVFGSLASIGSGMGAERLPVGLPPSAALLLRYDANHDGIITKDEMEAGLKADFAEADSDHDGCLNPEEVRAENQRRLARDGAQASPLVDWNLDGCVDPREFGTTVRSYFSLVDKKKDGRVTLNELRGPSMPIAPPTVEKKAPPSTDSKTGDTSSKSQPTTTAAPHY
jgi:hypothetical protein